MQYLRQTLTFQDSVRSHVKALRISLRMSQAVFAEALGVSLKTISRYETSDPPTAEALDRLAEFAKKKDRPDFAEGFRRLRK